MLKMGNLSLRPGMCAALSVLISLNPYLKNDHFFAWTRLPILAPRKNSRQSVETHYMLKSVENLPGDMALMSRHVADREAVRQKAERAPAGADAIVNSMAAPRAARRRSAAHRFRCLGLFAVWLGLALAAHAQTADASYRQSRDDAWWTGPMMANSADTLPRGHFLAEPYLYDVASKGADRFGSRTYMLYGLTDRVSVGLIPIVGYNRISGAPDSSGVGFADQILQAQFRLTRFQEGNWLPTISLLLQESVPTGHYDRLQRASDGMGQGAWTTTLGLNMQSYFWMPNGRILRVRLNLARTFAGHTSVDGASVFGTGPDFHGRASLGPGYSLDTSFEYSLTRRWVLALDLLHSHTDASWVNGEDVSAGLFDAPVHTRIGSTDAFGYAPAVECSFTPQLGMLLGVRFIVGGHNVSRSVTPAVAINYVY